MGASSAHRIYSGNQDGAVTRARWFIGWAGLLLLATLAGVHFLPVQRPPAPSAAKLPASARILLQSFRRETLDLALDANGELQYRIAMQAGATLVYAWTAGRRTVAYQFADQKPGRAGEAHGAFVAQSSGWYRWRWNNPTGAPITIHLKLSGYYEPAAVPPTGMPYDR
jgi:hypothetical protein